MSREIRGLTSIRTLRKVKHRSIPRSEGTDDAEIYLLKNNLILAKKEKGAIDERKKTIEKKISEIEERVAELESNAKKRRPKNRSVPPAIKSSMRVMKVDY